MLGEYFDMAISLQIGNFAAANIHFTGGKINSVILVKMSALFPPQPSMFCRYVSLHNTLSEQISFS